MTVLHSGTTKQFSQNWAAAFGEKKPSKKAATKSAPAKKKPATSAKKKAPAKKSGKKK